MTLSAPRAACPPKQKKPQTHIKIPLCLRIAQLYEEVRKSLEQCDVEKDIEHFINLRRTGEKPAGMTSGPVAGHC